MGWLPPKHGMVVVMDVDMVDTVATDVATEAMEDTVDGVERDLRMPNPRLLLLPKLMLSPTMEVMVDMEVMEDTVDGVERDLPKLMLSPTMEDMVVMVDMADMVDMAVDMVDMEAMAGAVNIQLNF